MNYGWICPRCGTVNAPHVDICKNCSPAKEYYTAEITKSLDNIPSDCSEGVFANLLACDYYLEWDTERLLYKKFKNNVVVNDIAWEQIKAWWISPLIPDEVLTIVVKGMSGFLYSFDCKAGIDTSLFIEKVFRYYLKDKEIKQWAMKKLNML